MCQITAGFVTARSTPRGELVLDPDPRLAVVGRYRNLQDSCRLFDKTDVCP